MWKFWTHQFHLYHENYLFSNNSVLWRLFCLLSSALVSFFFPFTIHHPLCSFPFNCLCLCPSSGWWLFLIEFNGIIGLNHVVKSFLEEKSYFEPKITVHSFHMKPFFCFSLFICIFCRIIMWSSFVSFLFHSFLFR